MNYNGLKEDKRLVKVVPSARQIAYENMEFFCFIHFTVNTFTGSEWGDGTEPGVPADEGRPDGPCDDDDRRRTARPSAPGRMVSEARP